MTKATLQSFQARKKEIEQLHDIIRELESRMTSPKIQQLTGMPQGGTHDNDKMTAMVAKHLELMDLYSSKIKELETEKNEVEKALDQLDSREREVLRRRYIYGESWKRICGTMGFSPQWAAAIHRSAIQKLEDK